MMHAEIYVSTTSIFKGNIKYEICVTYIRAALWQLTSTRCEVLQVFYSFNEEWTVEVHTQVRANRKYKTGPQIVLLRCHFFMFFLFFIENSLIIASLYFLMHLCREVT